MLTGWTRSDRSAAPRDEQDRGGEPAPTLARRRRSRATRLFHELLDRGQWLGEDLSFFRRVPPTIPVECLVTGNSSHNGVPLKLENVLLAHLAESKCPA